MLNLLSSNVHPVEDVPEDDPDNLVVPEVEDDPLPIVLALSGGRNRRLCRGNLHMT